MWWDLAKVNITQITKFYCYRQNKKHKNRVSKLNNYLNTLVLDREKNASEIEKVQSQLQTLIEKGAYKSLILTNQKAAEDLEKPSAYFLSKKKLRI